MWRTRPILARAGPRLRLQPPPLVGTEHTAKSEQHPRVGFLKFRSSLRNVIDLRQHAFLIRLIHFKQRFERRLFLFHGSSQIDQLQAVLLEQGIDTLLLIGAQAETRYQRRVHPPALSARAHASIRWWPARTSPRGSTSRCRSAAWPWSAGARPLRNR